MINYYTKMPIESIPAKNIAPIKIHNKCLGELFTESKQYMNCSKNIITELKNKCDKVFAYEDFCLEPEFQRGTGFLITVKPEYRQKGGYNFGEILRLSTIMSLLNNKIKTFEIYSKDTAIYFHSKYQFKPAITDFAERNYALRSIIDNCKKNGDKYKEIGEKAEWLYSLAKTESEPSVNRALCVKTNALLKEYIQKVMETKGEYKKHPFSFGMSMLLTDENIIKNKEFFNNLFKKHGIDYTI